MGDRTCFSFGNVDKRQNFWLTKKLSFVSGSQRRINIRDVVSIFGFLLSFLCHLLSLCGLYSPPYILYPNGLGGGDG